MNLVTSQLEKFKALPLKKKLMLGLIIILFGVSLNMGLSMFFPDNDSNNPSPIKTTEKPAVPKRQSVPQQNNTIHSPQYKDIPPHSALDDNAEKMAPSPEQLAILAESQALQKKYIQLVNEYQLAQIEQKLGQTNAEIARDKLTTLKTQVETEKLAANLGGADVSSILNNNKSTSQPTAHLSAVFVGRKNNIWTAILRQGMHYNSVREGDYLKNGFFVYHIDMRGVILEKNKKYYHLNIASNLQKP